MPARCTMPNYTGYVQSTWGVFMKIGDIYVDSTAFGVIALVVSALSALFTYLTNRALLRETEKTAAANSRMADANEAMLIESRRMSDANQQMARSNEEMV